MTTSTCRYCGDTIARVQLIRDPEDFGWVATEQPIESLRRLCREAPVSVLYHDADPVADVLNAAVAARASRVPFIAPESPEWEPSDGEGTRYGLDDQPTTCPHCGARCDVADVEDDGSQKATCLACGFRFVGDWDDWEDDATTDRVLHLGIVRTVPWKAKAPTSGYGVCLGYADVTIYPGEDSYRNWGNTDDPDEDHTDDGTRHIVIDWTDDPVADEDETARAIMDRYAHYLKDAGLPWRVADYAIWSDAAHSENQRLVTR